MDVNATGIDEQFVAQWTQLIKAGNKQALGDLLESHVRKYPASASFALLFVASQLAQNGQYAEAIPLYLEALRIKPTEPLIYFYLGLAYHALNLRQECHHIWDELLQRFPDHPAADYQSALRLIDDNRMQQAKPLLEKAISKLGDTSPVRAQILSTLNVVKNK